jgi:hypothetical protein
MPESQNGGRTTRWAIYRRIWINCRFDRYHACLYATPGWRHRGPGLNLECGDWSLPRGIITTCPERPSSTTSKEPPPKRHKPLDYFSNQPAPTLKLKSVPNQIFQLKCFSLMSTKKTLPALNNVNQFLAKMTLPALNSVNQFLVKVKYVTTNQIFQQ